LPFCQSSIKSLITSADHKTNGDKVIKIKVGMQVNMISIIAAINLINFIVLQSLTEKQNTPMKKQLQ